MAINLLLTCLLAALYDVSNAGPVHKTVPEIPQLSPQEDACLEHAKFYSEKTKLCHELQTQGPCAADERFVLRKPHDSESKLILKAVCVKSKCGDKKYWPPTDSCVSVSEKEKLCGPSPKVILEENAFGEGECACKKVPPHARLNDDPDAECFELYQRGPCSIRHVLAIPENGTTPQCIPDKCYEETLELREKYDESRKTAVWFNGGCHEVEKSGPPCSQNGTLKISSAGWLRRPICENLKNYIAQGGCMNGGPCGSKINRRALVKNYFANQLLGSKFSGKD